MVMGTEENTSGDLQVKDIRTFSVEMNSETGNKNSELQQFSSQDIQSKAEYVYESGTTLLSEQLCPLVSDKSLVTEDRTDSPRIETSDSIERDFKDTGTTRFSLIKNLIIISVSFLLIFTAFDAFGNLQSSLNAERGLGTTGLALIYVFMILTNLFVATLTLSRFNTKWIMVIATVTYIVYIATGYYPSWYTIIPASAVIGFGASHLWLSAVIYVTTIAQKYARITKAKDANVINLFMGVFYGVLFGCNVSGNLMSSLVLHNDNENYTARDDVICGARFCPYKIQSNSTIVLPPASKIYLFTSICVGIVALSLLLMALCLSNIPTTVQRRKGVCESFKEVIVHLFRSNKQKLLILPSIFSGLLSGFGVGDFTLAFVSCGYGVGNVGFVMICYGVSVSFFSFAFGKLNQYMGHVVIYSLGFVAEMSLLITMLLWTPRMSQFYMVFILAALIGIGGSINSPVLQSLYTLYFEKNIQTAQSACRFLSSTGLALAFGYSSVLCTNHKIYILMTMLVISLLCIACLHFRNKNKDK